MMLVLTSLFRQSRLTLEQRFGSISMFHTKRFRITQLFLNRDEKFMEKYVITIQMQSFGKI